MVNGSLRVDNGIGEFSPNSSILARYPKRQVRNLSHIQSNGGKSRLD